MHGANRPGTGDALLSRRRGNHGTPRSSRVATTPHPFERPNIPETETLAGKMATDKKAGDKTQKVSSPKTPDPAADKAKPQDIKKTKDKTVGKPGKMTAMRNERED